MAEDKVHCTAGLLSSSAGAMAEASEIFYGMLIPGFSQTLQILSPPQNEAIKLFKEVDELTGHFLPSVCAFHHFSLLACQGVDRPMKQNKLFDFPLQCPAVFLRKIARMLADQLRQPVVIVDTSNEIRGDGEVPHSGIGRARRMQVPNVNMQHNVDSPG
ncbi:hypothetical protein Nepgr_025097 [Nepenthes gracilis]|uniref:Uncharacterized protein n=1 Tax=Nepenthes gracilis TaxID=150966 RepID=A0AAD3T6A5_NEPGR|nr:hypothetical protein Nepgr_025097 [Nepenthes gracilis]